MAGRSCRCAEARVGPFGDALAGLKDRLAVSDDPEAEVLGQDVERLEQEIEDLTEFSPGSTFGEQAENG